MDLPDGAPEVSDVLADLVRNDSRIENFRGGGTFVLESPEFDAIKKFRGSIRFRRPSDLYVQGNHRLTNIPVFKMTCVGPEFLMEFPGSKDQSFYQLEGEVYDDVPFSVSPSDVAREMFLPESWDKLKRRETRIVAFDSDSGIATLAVGPRSRPRRFLEVERRNPENPSWVVVRNIRMGDDGHILAETNLTGYSVLESTIFPTEIDAWFPTEATRMQFRMKNIQLNTELPEKYFDIRARASELNLAGTSDFESEDARRSNKTVGFNRTKPSQTTRR